MNEITGVLPSDLEAWLGEDENYVPAFLKSMSSKTVEAQKIGLQQDGGAQLDARQIQGIEESDPELRGLTQRLKALGEFLESRRPSARTEPTRGLRRVNQEEFFSIDELFNLRLQCIEVRKELESTEGTAGLSALQLKTRKEMAESAQTIGKMLELFSSVYLEMSGIFKYFSLKQDESKTLRQLLAVWTKLFCRMSEVIEVLELPNPDRDEWMRKWSGVATDAQKLHSEVAITSSVLSPQLTKRQNGAATTLEQIKALCESQLNRVQKADFSKEGLESLRRRSEGVWETLIWETVGLTEAQLETRRKMAESAETVEGILRLISSSYIDLTERSKVSDLGQDELEAVGQILATLEGVFSMMRDLIGVLEAPVPDPDQWRQIWEKLSDATGKLSAHTKGLSKY